MEAPREPLALERLTAAWQRALDSADRAASAASASLPPDDVAVRHRELTRERELTAALIGDVARVSAVRPVPWLSRVPVVPALLGLDSGVRACLFDLDGVLTDSAASHAAAWGEVFDELLLRLGERTGRQFVRFDHNGDYDTYIDGRPRLDGVHAFLDSRGIRLPEGRPDDPADADTAYGVARRKGEALARQLLRRGIRALGGARRYLEAAGRAGLARGVVSASASTDRMIGLAGFDALVDGRVDAEVIRAEHLRSRPAPDLLLSVCRQLEVAPGAAVTFTHSPAGVAAGRAAGVRVVGVAAGTEADVLRGYGADRVVPSLSALLDHALAGTRTA